MKRLEDKYQLKMLVLLGTEVFWSNDRYKVVTSRDDFMIVCDNGFANALEDVDGVMQDKIEEFYIKELKVGGEVIQNRQQLHEVLQRMSQDEINAKSKKMTMIRGSQSLYDKVLTSKHYNREIRKMQDEYDYAMLHFWKLVDILEGTI